jgi:hypothetical protein
VPGFILSLAAFVMDGTAAVLAAAIHCPLTAALATVRGFCEGER